MSWRFLSFEGFDVDTGLSLYTNPSLTVGPTWGPGYVALAEGGLDRLGILRLPVGLAARMGPFRAFLETGGQGAGGVGPRYVLLPIPFPYLALGASYAF